MGDVLPRIRLAAVQASSVFLDREGSVDKACRLIREAGAEGADLIGFPEGFIPTHPIWFHFLPVSSQRAMELSRELFKNAMTVSGPETEALSQACRESGVVAVIGICEKEPDTTGTMYNTQLIIDRDGTVLGRRRKLVPTLAERVVHAPGDGTSVTAFPTHFGRISALLCAENANPLAALVLAVQSTVVHVASWPYMYSHGLSGQDVIESRSRGLAETLRAFVVNSPAILDRTAIDACASSEHDRAIMEAPTGGASILDPRGRFVAGPMPPGEGILYADVDLEAVLIPKIAADFGGHYNRFDLFQVLLDVGDGDYVNVTASGGAAQRLGVPLRPFSFDQPPADSHAKDLEAVEPHLAPTWPTNDQKS